MGYAGGTKKNPTYHSLGDHTETVEMDFNPGEISYEELLDIFWDAHSPTSRSWSRQYMSAVFYNDQKQKKLAEKSKTVLEEKLGETVRTKILPVGKFYLAEDYHQKYRLRSSRTIYGELTEIYPDWRDLTDSTAAARANGYIAGYGDREVFREEIDRLGLSEESKKILRRVME